ncbi:hypothetical protein MY10362_004879 [Beauveria mimosiformis]
MTVDAAIGLSFLGRRDQQSPLLRDRFGHMFQLNWTNTTECVRVLRDLILPMALYKQDAPADRVKRVFVFSDVQPNTAELRIEGKWQS